MAIIYACVVISNLKMDNFLVILSHFVFSTSSEADSRYLNTARTADFSLAYRAQTTIVYLIDRWRHTEWIDLVPITLGTKDGTGQGSQCLIECPAILIAYI